MSTRRTAADIVDAVAKAGRSLFSARSPSAVSVREISAEAGVNLGLIHRYVGSKDDIIALVLERHTDQARSFVEAIDDNQLIERVVANVAENSSTGRLLAGMVLDSVDLVSLKSELPLLDRLASDRSELESAIAVALLLGWEIFGESLVEALDSKPSTNEVYDALVEALGPRQAAKANS